MARGYLTPWRGTSLAPTSGYGGLGGSIFDLQRRMDRLFDEMFHREGGQAGIFGASSLGAPALDIHQDDKQVEITAELPGVKEEDIDLTIEDGVLTLSGEKRSEREDREKGYSERSYGRFERRISLPANVDEDACKADFRDGVLRITFPRSEAKARGRRIPLGQRQPAAHNDAEPAPKQEAAQESGSPGSSGRGGQQEGQQS